MRAALDTTAKMERVIMHIFMGLLFLILSTLSTASAADVTLTWNANTESDLAGYKLYQGTVSGQYGPPVTLGKVTTYTLTLPSLDVDQSYFWALSAYDLAGNESGKSVELSKLVAGTPPPPALPTPTNFTATTLPDGTTRLAWDDMQLPVGTGYLLRVHADGTSYEPCSSLAWCGDVFMETSKILALPAGTYDAWVHSAQSGAVYGPLAGLSFTVTAPVDAPPAPPTGFQIMSATASEVVIVASAKDCTRVVTSTKGTTSAQHMRTVSCVK